MKIHSIFTLDSTVKEKLKAYPNQSKLVNDLLKMHLDIGDTKEHLQTELNQLKELEKTYEDKIKSMEMEEQNALAKQKEEQALKEKEEIEYQKHHRKILDKLLAEILQVTTMEELKENKDDASYIKKLKDEYYNKYKKLFQSDWLEEILNGL